MLRFYPYYTKNHPFLISKTVFKINNSMIYYLITIVSFLYYIFSRNQIIFQSTFQNLKGSIYLCFHCTDGDIQFICDLLVLESTYTTQFKNGFTLIR